MYPWSKMLWYSCAQVSTSNSLVLHCASPSAHNIATKGRRWFSPVALKEVTKAPFEVQMLLMAILITLPWSKLFVLKLATVAKNDYLKPKLSFYNVILRWNENDDPSFFICAFYSLWLHKRYILSGKRILIVEVVFFLAMNEANFWAVNKTRIGLLGSDRTDIRLKFKVTLKVIACWLLYDCEGLG